MGRREGARVGRPLPWRLRPAATALLLLGVAWGPGAAAADPAPAEQTCRRADADAPNPVDMPLAPPAPYTDAERACWIGWREARQLAAQGASWVDVREAGAAQRLRLAGALAVPRAEVADKAALRGLDLLAVGDAGDLRALSRQCAAWRQSGLFGSVHVVLGGVRAWRLAGMPVQPDPQAATPPQLPTVVSAAEYRQGVVDGLWRVVTLGIAPDDAHALAQPPVLALPAADAAGLRALRQALDGMGDGGAPTSIPSFWLAVAADAVDQARLQALWDLQRAAQPLLWLHEGLDGYRRYLVQQHQLAAHAGRALPRLCGL